MQTTPNSQALSKSLIFLMALTTGMAVSTIYLNQPLLSIFAQVFDAPIEQIGRITTLTQIGYGLGILFLVPLGDVLPKKKLVLTKLILLALSLFLTGFAPTLSVLIAGSLLLGLFGTVAQDMVPLAADLAPERSRGQVIGTVMSGLLIGILGSRTLSGVIAHALNWQAVFLISGAAIVVIILLLWFKLPDIPVKKAMSYPQLLASMWMHLRTKPLLRSSIRTHSLLGLAFSAFWTNLAFYLGGEPFHLNTMNIGFFGLAGAAGALIAPITGRLVDKRGPIYGILIGVTLVAVSFAGMLIVPQLLPGIIIGAVVFDLGVQMSLVSHQTIVYALEPSARARLNAVFISSMFIAFALGSTISVALQSRYGWPAVLIFCLASAFLSLLSAVRAKSLLTKTPN